MEELKKAWPYIWVCGSLAIGLAANIYQIVHGG